MHNKSFLSALDISKLEKLKKLNLDKIKKINLGLTDDAQKLTNVIEKEIDFLKDGIIQANALIKEIDILNKQFEVLNKTYDNVVEEIKDSINNAEKFKDEGLDLFYSLRDSADKLGIDVSDIKQAVDLDIATVNVEDFITDADAILNKLADKFNK